MSGNDLVRLCFLVIGEMTVYESYEKFEIKKHYCGMTGIMSSGNLLYFTQT